MFKDEQFFECAKDCAVFVALDRLSDSNVPVITKPPVTAGSSSSSGNKNSKGLQKQKSVEQQQKLVEQQQKQMFFKIGDKVMAFGNDGETVYGTVRWTGGTTTGSGKLVGIETVSHLIC